MRYLKLAKHLRSSNKELKFVQDVCSAIIVLLYVVIFKIRRTHGTQNLIFLNFP